MKSLIFAILVVLAITLSVADDDFQQKFEQARIDCLSETGADKKLADDLKDKGILVDDPKLKEFIFCVNKKTGYQNEDGDLQADVIRKVVSGKYSEAQVNKMLEKCLEKKATPQETGYQGLKCALEIAQAKQ